MTICVYTIDSTEDELRITGFESYSQAMATTCPEGWMRAVVQSQEELAAIGDGLLLRVYNFKKIRGKAITALSDGAAKSKVVAAIWSLLQHNKHDDKAENIDEKELTGGVVDGTDTAKEGNTAEPQPEEGQMAIKRTSTKKAKAAKAARKTKAKKTGATGTKNTGPRGEKTLKVKALLQRKSGCTSAEVLEATGWPAVSMPAMAKACGLKLRKEKEKGSGKPTRYFGEAKA